MKLLTHPFPNLNGATVEVWVWISKLISHFTGHVIIYPHWGQTDRQVSNISRTLVGNEIVDHSYVVGASPVCAAPTTSSFST